MKFFSSKDSQVQSMGLLIALSMLIAVGFVVLYFKTDFDNNLLVRNMSALSQQIALNSRLTVTEKPTAKPTTVPTSLVPTNVTSNDPISFSTKGIDVRVSKRWWIGGLGLPTPLMDELNVSDLKAMADECGHTPKSDAYYKTLINKLRNQEAIQYDITYNGPSQAPTYTLYVVPNAVGYKTIDELKVDLDVCAAGGVYPFAVNAKWLVFTGSCGGAADSSEPAPQCGIIQQAVNATLKLVE